MMRGFEDLGCTFYKGVVELKKPRKSSLKEPFIFAIELLELGPDISTETMSDFRC